MAKDQIEIFLTSLVFRKGQLNQIRYQNTSIIMATIPGIEEDETHWNSRTVLVKSVKWHNHFGKHWHFFKLEVCTF